MLYYWNEKTAFNFDLTNTLSLFCVGSTEQHSNYLPLGTDSIIGERLAEMAAQKAKSNVMMLPAQHIGYSPHHRAFPGYLTLSQDTMFRYLFEICGCILENGGKQIMLFNSHGGNQTCLQSVANEVGSKLGGHVVVVRYWDLIADRINNIRETKQGGMGHACELETSLMLYLCPDLVDRTRIDERSLASGGKWHHPDMFARNKIYTYKPFDEYSAQGNIGQPIYATQEKGKQIAEAVIQELAELLDYQVSRGF